METRSQNKGTSLHAAVLAALVIAIGASVSVIAAEVRDRNASVRAAMSIVSGELQRAHDRAVAEHRDYVLTLVGPRTIEVRPAGLRHAQPEQWQQLPAQAELAYVNGLSMQPTSASLRLESQETPSNAAELVFAPDGRIFEHNGRTTEAIVYITGPDADAPSSAITIDGSKGRIRTWRLNQSGSTWTWEQP